MARYRHYSNKAESGELAIVTTTCLDFVHAFEAHELRDSMVASLIEDHVHYGSSLHALVVMPHHIHFVAAVPEGRTVSWLLNRIKSNSARRILPLLSDAALAGFDEQRELNGRSFWQRSFRSVPIETEKIFWQKVGYIHDNPVRAGLAMQCRDYKWLSARFFAANRWNEASGLSISRSEFGELLRWDRTRDPQPLGGG